MKKLLPTILVVVSICALLSSCVGNGIMKPSSNNTKSPEKTSNVIPTPIIPTPDTTPDTAPITTPSTDLITPDLTPSTPDVLPDTVIPTPVIPSPNKLP
ncbi:MAG: hypothetical protein J6R60_01810 [Clostridia bacterium]|nr:hypothetical protein [Clostridia bacterium]